MFNNIKNMFTKNNTENRDKNIPKNNNQEPIFLAKRSEIALNSAKVVTVNNEEIAIFNANNQFYAISNLCVHRGGPLGEGSCEGTIVTCPWHMWKFDVTTGKCIHNSQSVKRYEIEVSGEEIFLKS